MKFLSRLKLWQKLAVLVVAMAIPSALLGVFYLSGANAQVALAQDEIDGARYAQTLGAVLAEIANHRGRLFAVLAGDTARRDALGASDLEMDKDIAAVDASDARVGGRFKVSETWLGIRADWLRLKAEGLKLAPDEAVNRHTELIQRLSKLSETVAARSGLTVDPSAQTAVLIDIAIRDVPSALIESGDVRWYAARASIKGYLGGDDRMAIQLYHDSYSDDFDSAARRLERASNEAKARVQPQIEAARSAFAAFFAVIKTRILDAQKMDITTAEVYTASGNVSTALKELSDVSYAAMTAAVEQRLHAVTTWRNLTAGITALALAFALALSWLITRSMARPLAHAIAVFRKISAGKYDSEIRLTGTDEASQVLSALSASK